MSITFRKWVFLTLFIQYAKCMSYFIQGGAEPTDTFQMAIDNVWKKEK